ncbi:PoNe immunity protein domain-containing protein [Pseudomonas sp. BC42]|uniref:PoNe immunity protein domain-containing protein n=1 Tax=Pseudomonas sp. BC42 TaxID=2933816 RepID=UPI0032AF0EDE
MVSRIRAGTLARQHLQGDEDSYCGYWAFEAAAIVFLYGLDDSEVEHRVYPKTW